MTGTQPSVYSPSLTIDVARFVAPQEQVLGVYPCHMMASKILVPTRFADSWCCENGEGRGPVRANALDAFEVSPLDAGSQFETPVTTREQVRIDGYPSRWRVALDRENFVKLIVVTLLMCLGRSTVSLGLCLSCVGRDEPPKSTYSLGKVNFLQH